MTKQSKKAEELTDIEKLKDPFDKLFRRSMQEKKIAIELLKTYLPAELVEKIDFNYIAVLFLVQLDQREQMDRKLRFCYKPLNGLIPPSIKFHHFFKNVLPALLRLPRGLAFLFLSVVCWESHICVGIISNYPHDSSARYILELPLQNNP